MFEEYLPLVMVAVLFGALMLGYPVAFTLGGVALFFGWYGFGLDFFQLLPLRIWGTMTNFTLLAVPLFVYMGVMLEKSGLAEELLETMALLFGRVRGGMAVSVVAVGALLAASTGIVGATVVTMGLLALPSMLRRNYQPELAVGVIASAGTLGQIIPPSIILVLLGDIMNVPVGDLFLGAVLPGLFLVGLYIAYILSVAAVKPHWAPAIPKDEREGVLRPELIRRIAWGLIPPLVLMVAVLGSIFAGIASPTESAAMGGGGAMLLAAMNKRLTVTALAETVRTTTRLTSMIFIILVGASAFGLVFRGLSGDDMIRDFLEMELFAGHGALVVVMAVLFLLGFFLDFIEITFIVVPIMAPILIDAGYDPVWLGVMIAMNLQTSFLTPPFGFSLFYLKGVAPPSITTGHLYRGAIPFVVIQLLALCALVIWPETVLWLPDLAREMMFGR